LAVELETQPKFALTPEEQERGLELQTTLPESTFAIRLPTVRVIESVKVLKYEFFSAKGEADVTEPLRALKNENLASRLEAVVSEALKERKSEVCSTKFEAAVIAPLKDLKRDDFSTKLEAEPTAAESDLTNVVFSDDCNCREAEGFWAKSQLGVRMSEAVDPVESVVVVAAVEPEYCMTCQYSTAR